MTDPRIKVGDRVEIKTHPDGPLDVFNGRVGTVLDVSTDLDGTVYKVQIGAGGYAVWSAGVVPVG